MQKKGEGGSKVRRKGARAAALRYRSHGSAAKHTRVRVLGPQALGVFAALTDRMEVWVPPAVPQRLEQGLHAPHSPTCRQWQHTTDGGFIAEGGGGGGGGGGNRRQSVPFIQIGDKA